MGAFRWTVAAALIINRPGVAIGKGSAARGCLSENVTHRRRSASPAIIRRRGAQQG